jgi:lactate dehydrogenase-like 2-hydroxyacid dehydrogenase
MSKTVGIIGYGSMGNALLKKLRGFLEVLCYDMEHVGDANAKQVSLKSYNKSRYAELAYSLDTGN